MRLLIICAYAFAWTFVSSTHSSVTLAQRQTVATPENVENAINRGIDFLLLGQKSNGSYPGQTKYETGQTCLATLALLNCGVEPDSARVADSIEFIRRRRPTQTYETALQLMVLSNAEPAKDLAIIQDRVNLLVETQGSGGWGYSIPQPIDPSNSQFALLGLWEAQRAGAKVPPRVFVNAAKYWLQGYSREGAWGYTNWGASKGASGSMTCAGIASLLISEDALEIADAKIQNGKIRCCGGSNQPDKITRSFDWLARHFSVRTNPRDKNWHMYYLYALERAGRLSGRRFIGDHDWYREGAEWLISAQQRSGAFRSNGGAETDAITTTAMGLLFLSKGKRKVVIGHLQYGPQNDWRHHRHAVNHLTGHIEQYWKQDLTWQSVRLENARLSDLLAFPVLFISGSQQIVLNDREKKLLTDYVRQGGFIFAEACDGDGCNGTAFDESFQRLMLELFEKPLKKLPLSHPIWYAEEKTDPSAIEGDFWLYGVEECCRTSVVYSPRSLSCRWELLKPYGATSKLPDSVRNDVETAIKIGLNVAAYATGRELRDKLEPIEIFEEGDQSLSPGRGQLELPVLNHGGDPDATPKSMPTLVSLFRKQFFGHVSTEPILIDPVTSALQEYSIVYLHGRQAFSFTEEQRIALRQYFETGGFIIGDATCASKEFAKSVREELKLILPNASLQRVAADHPMLTPEFDGFDVRNVTLLDPVAREVGGEFRVRSSQGPPELEMLVYEDRVVAVFSPVDLSCALESTATTQCLGYSREDAAKIGINLILFARLQ